jgi:hypothetical protein
MSKKESFLKKKQIIILIWRQTQYIYISWDKKFQPLVTLNYGWDHIHWTPHFWTPSLSPLHQTLPSHVMFLPGFCLVSFSFQ